MPQTVGLVVVNLRDLCASSVYASNSTFFCATGLKTTCVCPYFINTGMFDGAKSKYVAVWGKGGGVLWMPATLTWDPCNAGSRFYCPSWTRTMLSIALCARSAQTRLEIGLFFF